MLSINGPVYEDSYAFTFCDVRFTLRCKSDKTGVLYFPTAHLGDQVAHGRMLREQTSFQELHFASPPQWLLRAVGPEYSWYEEPRRGGKYKTDGELVIFLSWQGVIEPIKAWARGHCFIGRERTVLRSWQTARGIIEVCSYAMHQLPYLEIATWDNERQVYTTPGRIAGEKDHLMSIAIAMAKVARARERTSKKRREKRLNVQLGAIHI